MKIRTALISVVVSGALIAGALYAAYYTVGLGKKTPVQVVPVSYVYIDMGYYSDEDSMSGTITSRVSQNIELESDYSIEEIYVSVGDEVTEGTELFSYDMTAEEIQLEELEIELQVAELNLKRNQKDLAKYTGTSTTTSTTTASLEDTSTVLTSSADVVSEESQTDAGDTAATSGSADTSAESSDTIEASEKDEIIDDSTEEGETSDDSDNLSSDDSELTIVGVEELASDDGNTEYKSYVTNFVSLMSALQEYVDTCIDEYGESFLNFDSDEVVYIGEQLLGSEDDDWTGVSIVDYYRDKLADETGEVATDASGNTFKYYFLKEDADQADLSESEISQLMELVAVMDKYHGQYVDWLINALSDNQGDDLVMAVETARTAYENLSGDAMSQVTLLLQLESYEAQVVDYLIQTAAELAESQDAAAFADAVTEARTAYDSLGSNAKSQVSFLSVLKILEAQLTEESESQTESESESGTETETETQTESGTESEDVDIAARISAFLLMADEIFSESAVPTVSDYENAIAFFQMYLAVAEAQIEGVETTMEQYSLSDEATTYLAGLGTEGSMTASELLSEYQSLCLAYVKALVSSLDSQTMTSEDLAAVQEAYDQLGTAWQILVDDETPSVSDYLTAYDMILRIQALETMDPESEEFMTELSALYTEYLSLTAEQLELIWNISTLVELFAQYGLLAADTESETESETETETEFFWDDSYDSYDSDGDSMTAEERQEAIDALEQAIKENELDIRQAELEVAKQQRIVDKKVVTASIDGTVVNIGDEDGNSESDYFATITNTTGLYAKGWISELELETVNVGDLISGVSDYGDTFTAVIKEVSEYPDPSGSSYVYSGNSNASYYAFYALIDDSEGIEEGYAELTLSDAYAGSSDSFYLESYFVRKDSTGNSYVYVEGDDGTLEMRYVTTGSSLWGYYIEIKGGLSLTDYIAFPYGDNVYEGAPAEEVDELTVAYGE